ncbi:MAG: Sec-independent protein translocase protein TatAd [Planctomycetes bacterium ADurb.Bin126]|nr:MAG: Sec-independent protein translocase protein TatAd [Planctomycetes bacterium ADurb.Bin126]HOD79996.1 twin-arginine translocase TatA/TatE family subunit [Phycisphaerae bacterium]HQL74052.1 twin-arginine translocase TatA/TatE family subunit [Phycisphaerae bacterium]
MLTVETGAALAFIQNIGVPGFVIILIAMLLLFGGKKLPELARGLGKGLRGFKEELNGIQKQIEEEPKDDKDDVKKA